MTNIIAQCFDGLSDGPNLAQDLERFKAADRRCYMICFTPRSGSSWVSDLLIATQKLGRPLEWFNPSFIGQNAKSFGCSNIVDYSHYVRGKMATPNGVFGVELTFFHLNPLMTLIDIFDVLGKDIPVFYLRRRNFLMQGISLYKATHSGLFHARDDASLQAIRDKDSEIPYDGEQIRHWIQHILQQEYGFEQFFKKRQIEPLRMSYEQVRERPFRLIRRVANSVGEPISPELVNQSSNFEVIRTKKNDMFASRFRRENPEFMAVWQKQRGQRSAW